MAFDKMNKKIAWAICFFGIQHAAVLATPVNPHRVHSYRGKTPDSENSRLQLTHASEDSTNNTAQLSNLNTWWHNTGEINTQTPVQNGNVRQSHMYNIKVATSDDSSNFYDSFVYETLPRNGNGKICDPTDAGSFCDTDDQISIEADIGVDMAWTQYVTSTDTIVQVTRSDGGSVDASNVIIRPTTTPVKLSSSGDTLLIQVPYNANGYRFSVEFNDNLWTYRNAGGGIDSHYVQNKNPNGAYYVSSYTDDMPIVGVEPLNALLVFVSPFNPSLVPDQNSSDTYVVPEGQVTGLDSITQSTVYFAPGVYWCTGTAHALLSSSVTWVYLAPGAYVKGAIEWQTSELELKATGFGVLSGEQYVYQANTADGYKNEKSDDTSLKMWRGEVSNGATWTLSGPTMNAPPFNSMDLYADDLNTLSVQAWDYKQVGAFFGQTDGTEIYPGSHIHDNFYHVGDDGIKTYYSNVLVERVAVWKTNNAPITQFGWYPRSNSNITVDSVDVIHTRYISQSADYPRALVGSAANYENADSTQTADTSKNLNGFSITNWRCEGICPALLGINPLQNIDNMLFSNIQIEELAPDTTQLDMSSFAVFTDGSGNAVALGDNSDSNLGLIIEDYSVGGVKVSFDANNWDSFSLGRLNIDGHWENRWTVR